MIIRSQKCFSFDFRPNDSHIEKKLNLKVVDKRGIHILPVSIFFTQKGHAQAQTEKF